MAKKIMGLLVALCLIVGLLPMAVLADEAPASVKFTLVDNTVTTTAVSEITVNKGEAKWFKNVATTINTVAVKVVEATTEDAKWNLKLEYGDNGAVITMDGLDYACWSGISFGSITTGGTVTNETVPVKVVIAGDSSIVNLKDKGENRYFYHTALGLYTTGEATVESVGNAKLVMNSNFNGASKGTLYAAGDLDLIGANIHIDGEKEYGTGYAITTAGDVTIEGGNVEVYLSDQLTKAIVCKDLSIGKAATVLVREAPEDVRTAMGLNGWNSGKAPVIEADTIAINGANVDIGVPAKAFSNAPTVDNCDSAKAGKVNPVWENNKLIGGTTTDYDPAENADTHNLKTVHTCITAGTDCTTEYVCDCGIVISKASGGHVYDGPNDTACNNTGCTAGNRGNNTGSGTGGSTTGGSTTGGSTTGGSTAGGSTTGGTTGGSTTGGTTKPGATNGNDKLGDIIGLVIALAAIMGTATVATTKKYMK